ncbi:glycosyltransferase [Jeotgalibaca porci]|uniref:Glycosyltransferase n=1 Tax=Jeotgalibaca porci TaxID=1868793 RepID=A0A6G7WG56_9LACT|nr:glycosyltransferase [Jeotgalibaca porci]QIK51233.1 glycosyltransferase [Jeotgalibaca porci]
MKIKIVFVMSTLGTGGAERVISNILKYIDRNIFDVSLIILLDDSNDYIKHISQDITLINLGHKRTRTSIVDLIKTLRKLEPEIVFSSLRGVSLILSLIKPLLKAKTKFIFREENTPSISIKDTSTPNLYNLYYKTLYRKADLVICQSEFMKNDLVKEYSFPLDKTLRIYNPVDFSWIEEMNKITINPFKNPEKKNVIVVGRMANQKGIDILLKSILKNEKKILKHDVMLHFLGDGELLNEYKNMAKKLKISDYVEFVGRQENPFQWMKYSDLFILSSRYEGLPNSLLEAAASNCEIITSNHPGGTREIMKLIDREEFIVDELDWNEKWFSERQKPINKLNLIDNFEAKRIVKEYERAFKLVYNSKK